MDKQDFICNCSNLVWGGELGWDRDGGLEELWEALKIRLCPSGGLGVLTSDLPHVESENCFCSPTVEEYPNGNKLVIHRSGGIMRR